MSAAPRLLVVEDEKEMLELYRDFLSGVGYEVETAADGEEALGAAAARRFDLVVLDVMLPRLDGYHVARELTKRPGAPRILMATCRNAEREGALALLSGASAVMEKPIDLTALLAKIEQLLGAPAPRRRSAADA